MLVDSHCHLDRLDKTPEELAEVVAQASATGVEHMLCVCVSLNDFAPMLKAIAPFNNVSASCGVHPLHQDEACTRAQLLDAASSEKVIAIGETGLDYYYSAETKAVQQSSFIDHIHVANQLNKPLIIHTRDAREDTLALLREHKAPHTKGVLHCFTENLDMALAAIDMGFYISLSGIVTFKAAQELKEVAKALPLERLLVETDSPWLAPMPHRGKPNQPKYVKEVAQYIADLRQMPLAELAKATTDNFYTLFDRIPRSA